MRGAARQNSLSCPGRSARERDVASRERAILRDEVNALKEARGRDVAATTRSLSAIEVQLSQFAASLSARIFGEGLAAAVDVLREDLARLRAN